MIMCCLFCFNFAFKFNLRRYNAERKAMETEVDLSIAKVVRCRLTPD